MPDPRSVFLEYLDVFVLILALSIVSWLVLKKRSRRGVFWMSIFSLAYFGFFREGCVCSIGAIQNVTLALFHPGYKIPLTVIAFFVIPLIFTLFFGRTFCAGVCPLGAIQDLFVFRPKELKPWLQSMLGLIPYIYLGLGVLYAATATDFVICRYDPFVGFFRLDATFFMFAIGGIFLITGIFIARPYCRFFCPYGVLLNLMSKVSLKHMTITPSNCIQCKLCEDSCPFGAIDKPVSVKIRDNREQAVKRTMLITIFIPLLILIGGWAGTRFHENLAQVNPTVRLANHLFDDEKSMSSETVIEVDAFKSSGKTKESLYTEAASIIDDFYWGGMLLGGFIGLVIGLTLLGMARFYHRTDYTPNKGTCLSCARCMDYCPVDKRS
jgi:ferredoxin